MSSLSEKFPDEIWLTIFNNKELLEYQHLKKLTRVSKHFRELVKSSVFDKTLFRTPLSKSKELTVGDKVYIHPMVNHHLNLVCSDQEAAFIFLSNEYDKDRTTKSLVEEILKFPALTEYATNPTASAVLIDMEEGYIVRNKSGVTVLDIINETIKFWNALPDQLMAYFDDYSNADEGVIHTRINNLCQYDNCTWAGWHYAQIELYSGKPIIFLQPGPFDS